MNSINTVWIDLDKHKELSIFDYLDPEDESVEYGLQTYNDLNVKINVLLHAEGIPFKYTAGDSSNKSSMFKLPQPTAVQRPNRITNYYYPVSFEKGQQSQQFEPSFDVVPIEKNDTYVYPIIKNVENKVYYNKLQYQNVKNDIKNIDYPDIVVVENKNIENVVEKDSLYNDIIITKSDIYNNVDNIIVNNINNEILNDNINQIDSTDKLSDDLKEIDVVNINNQYISPTDNSYINNEDYYDNIQTDNIQLNNLNNNFFSNDNKSISNTTSNINSVDIFNENIQNNVTNNLTNNEENTINSKDEYNLLEADYNTQIENQEITKNYTNINNEDISQNTNNLGTIQNYDLQIDNSIVINNVPLDKKTTQLNKNINLYKDINKNIYTQQNNPVYNLIKNVDENIEHVINKQISNNNQKLFNINHVENLNQHTLNNVLQNNKINNHPSYFNQNIEQNIQNAQSIILENTLDNSQENINDSTIVNINIQNKDKSQDRYSDENNNDITDDIVVLEEESLEKQYFDNNEVLLEQNITLEQIVDIEKETPVSETKDINIIDKNYSNPIDLSIKDIKENIIINEEYIEDSDKKDESVSFIIENKNIENNKMSTTENVVVSEHQYNTEVNIDNPDILAQSTEITNNELILDIDKEHTIIQPSESQLKDEVINNEISMSDVVYVSSDNEKGLTKEDISNVIINKNVINETNLEIKNTVDENTINVIPQNKIIQKNNVEKYLEIIPIDDIHVLQNDSVVYLDSESIKLKEKVTTDYVNNEIVKENLKTDTYTVDNIFETESIVTKYKDTFKDNNDVHIVVQEIQLPTLKDTEELINYKDIDKPFYNIEDIIYDKSLDQESKKDVSENESLTDTTQDSDNSYLITIKNHQIQFEKSILGQSSNFNNVINITESKNNIIGNNIINNDSVIIKNIDNVESSDNEQNLDEFNSNEMQMNKDDIKYGLYHKNIESNLENKQSQPDINDVLFQKEVTEIVQDRYNTIVDKSVEQVIDRTTLVNDLGVNDIKYVSGEDKETIITNKEYKNINNNIKESVINQDDDINVQSLDSDVIYKNDNNEDPVISIGTKQLKKTKIPNYNNLDSENVEQSNIFTDKEVVTKEVEKLINKYIKENKLDKVVEYVKNNSDTPYIHSKNNDISYKESDFFKYIPEKQDESIILHLKYQKQFNNLIEIFEEKIQRVIKDVEKKIEDKYKKEFDNFLRS